MGLDAATQQWGKEEMETLPTEHQPVGASALCRGIRRVLLQRGVKTLTEFTLKTGRRADIIGIDSAGKFLIVEIKSSIADFRSDHKWPEYRDFCDRFYFGVGTDFPTSLIPEDCGLLVADAYGAYELRPAPDQPLAAARRKKLVIDLALTACTRLHGLEDPGAFLDPSL